MRERIARQVFLLLVTLSGANFVLAQDQSNYDVRFRTTATSSWGGPATATTPGTLTTDLTHVVYTRDAVGAVTIYLDGVSATTNTVGGDTTAWDAGYGFALANEFTGNRPFVGDFCLVAVYDKALSTTEATGNYDAGCTLGGVPPDDPPAAPTASTCAGPSTCS